MLVKQTKLYMHGSEAARYRNEHEYQVENKEEGDPLSSKKKKKLFANPSQLWLGIELCV